MDLKKLNDWLQLFASLGVIAGLGLVAYQLQQDVKLTKVQMADRSIESFEEYFRASRDEATSRAMAKAIESPEELTVQDQWILGKYYLEVVTVVVAREQYMISSEIFGSADMERYARWAAQEIFGTSYGAAWWEVSKGDMYPGVAALIEKAREAYEPGNYLNTVRNIENELRQSGSE